MLLLFSHSTYPCTDLELCQRGMDLHTRQLQDVNINTVLQEMIYFQLLNVACHSVVDNNLERRKQNRKEKLQAKQNKRKDRKKEAHTHPCGDEERK